MCITSIHASVIVRINDDDDDDDAVLGMHLYFNRNLCIRISQQSIADKLPATVRSYSALAYRSGRGTDWCMHAHLHGPHHVLDPGD